MRRKRDEQVQFEFPEWGGQRTGAGRKPRGEAACVSHHGRAELKKRFPVHVTIRIARGLPGLREKNAHSVLVHSFRAGRNRFGFRLNHYSVQSNHVHMIVESEDSRSLARGMQGLQIRIAKALNKLWSRKGRVFADRFHDRILRTPREVRNVLAYVLNNGRRHGSFATKGAPDPLSSGRWFDGWREPLERVSLTWAPIIRARTWLQRVGWQRHGLIPLAGVPGK
jgi:putative transposase